MKADSNNEKNLGRKYHWNVLLKTFTFLVKRVFATRIPQNSNLAAINSWALIVINI